MRETGEGPWFLARFIASHGTLSAVMKCEDTAAIGGYVKKFSLAKVLKLDASVKEKRDASRKTASMKADRASRMGSMKRDRKSVV